MFLVYYLPVASIAQLIEQLTCNQQVVGLSPTAGSLKHLRKRKCFFIGSKPGLILILYEDTETQMKSLEN